MKAKIRIHQLHGASNSNFN